MQHYKEVISALTNITRFRHVKSDDFFIERLGGLTNLVFRVQHEQQHYLLRLPGKGTEEYINRADEHRAAQIAADAGVSAQLYYFDESNGIMLAEFIEGATLNSERFKDIGSVRRAGRALHRMHSSGEKFAKPFNVFEQIDEYLELVVKLNASLPEGYTQVKNDAGQVRRALQSSPVPLVPCHCDPLAETDGRPCVRIEP
ncbi:MAG: phosphotransferase family protein [Halieaceae bacterium]|nr:phosphotransferase family protein [Halieaceae bacterium]